ncbi:MAG: outer membrane protein assembly factor BamA [Nitrospinae bacterium]|nr:outer membrane protein assembly factor BamA [Nitrospinota bacterium]
MVFLSLSLLFEGVLSARAQSGKGTVREIEVVGNQRIEQSAILGRISLKVGDPLNPETTREQIRRIYDMGFFEDVQVQTQPVPNGVKMVFVVREKQFIVDIVFDGNSHFSDEKLTEVITLRSQVFLDQKEVKVSAEKIREAYREDGFQKASVIPIVQALDETRNRITFFIRESKRGKITTIIFDGRTVVRKKDLLDVMANQEWVPILSWITDAGILREEELPNDVERIKEVYSNRGYLDIQVGLPTVGVSKDGESFTLTFRIEEGQPYTIGTVKLEGNTFFEDEELELGSLVISGEVFQRAKVREEVTRITDLYGERGYSFAEVTPDLDPKFETLTADITFKIKEGSLIRVREIRISGNDKTRDNVIRRELRVDEQEVIDSVALKRSFQRLNNLNFFETVEILPTQVEEDKVDLEVKVKEKPTGSFSVGGGFSTLDQFSIVANITEGNLFGLGYVVRVRGQLSGRRTIGVLSFRNPAVFDGPTSFQVDVFSTETDFLTYEEKRQGGTIQFGRSFSEYIAGSLTLVGEAITIKNPALDAPQFIVDQVGDQSTTGFRTSLFRDSRDNFLNPRRGIRTGVRTGFGTEVLGGTNDFYSLGFDVVKYTPLPLWDLRVATKGRFGIAEGYGGDPVPLTELFFVGGINSVRGFEFGRAGPVTASDTVEGGNRQIIFNGELIFPVIQDAKLDGVLFFDYGKGFAEEEDLSLDLRPATGLEVRWVSPFGPLRAAYGLNLDPEPNEKNAVFEFSIGSVF